STLARSASNFKVASERASRKSRMSSDSGDDSGGVTWEDVPRLWSRLYFAWHSEEVDEFGYDPKFAARLLPFFELLYTVWWRVEATGIENVPRTGPALIVANHSGVLPWDGVMINLAVRHQHPG